MFPGTAAPARAEFGLLIDSPKHQEGVCTTEEIAALVSKCACKDETGALMRAVTLPFQGTARKDGQRWQLRIEQSGAHDVGGSMVQGHRWSFALAAGGDDQNR